MFQAAAPTTRATGWRTAGQNAHHFRELVKLCPVESRQILDAGCGLGDLEGAVRERWFDATYEGIDPDPDLVARAQELHPHGVFRVGDPRLLVGKWDVVVLTGALHGRCCDYWSYVREVLASAARASRVGVVATFYAKRSILGSTFQSVTPDQAVAALEEFFPSVRVVPSQRAPLWILRGLHRAHAKRSRRRPA